MFIYFSRLGGKIKKILIVTKGILLTMSELSELIEINKKIVKQNAEIIHLLKKIAGEEEYVEMKPQGEEFIDEAPEMAFDDLLDTSPDVGEVYFIDEDEDICRLTVKNNENRVDNLTGSTIPTNIVCQELVANKSIELNQPISEATVILNLEQSDNLPKKLRMCYEHGAKKVYLPWSSMTQLIGAPDTLMKLLKLDFYRTDEMLLEKVFNLSD